VRRLQAISIAWMVAEASVSLMACWRSKSAALLAFGGDSAIELASAVVVLWAFRPSVAGTEVEKGTARIAGVLLLTLAAFVMLVSAASLMGYTEPEPTRAGMAILVLAVMVMPWLALEKRKLSAATGSAALRADSAQSGMCAYMALLALAGLVTNALWQVRWADAVAALAITPLLIWEGREAIRGKPCTCH
jgi:divalent metal cation (Fe/Co/Zn/Cd) transporter